MTGRCFLLLSLVLLVPALAAAQSPCETPQTGQTVISPAKLAAQLPEHTQKVLDSDTWLIARYEVDYTAVGAAAPVQTITVPREAWTAVPNTDPVCYTAALPSAPLAPNIRFVATLRAIGSDGVSSVPSNSTDPFGWIPRPGAIPVLRIVR